MSRLRNRRLDFDERKIFDDYLLWDFDTRIERTTALYEESCRKEKKVVEKLERRKSKFLVRYARVWKILRQIRMQEYGLEIVTNKIQSDENAARKHFDAMSENVHAVKEREKNEMRKMNPNESHGKLVKIVDELQVARDQRDKAMFDLTRAIQKREVFREVMDGLELLLNTPLLHTFLREKHFAVAPPLPQIPVRVRQSIDAGIRGVSTKIESSQNLRGGEQLSSDGDSRDDHAHSDSESDNTEEDEDDSKPPLPPPTPQMRTTNFKGVSPSNAGDTTAADETEVSSTYTSGSSPRFLRTFGGVSSCSVEASQVFDGISRLNSANRKNYFLEERRVSAHNVRAVLSHTWQVEDVVLDGW